MKIYDPEKDPYGVGLQSCLALIGVALLPGIPFICMLISDWLFDDKEAGIVVGVTIVLVLVILSSIGGNKGGGNICGSPDHP